MRIATAPIRIGDLARETRKTVRALRYYEELGLLEPVDHTEGGFRLYRAEDAERVRLIERLQELGLPLQRILQIVKAWRQGATGKEAAGRLQALLEEGLRDPRERIGRLQQMEREMEEALRFLATCRSCGDQTARVRCSECEKGDHRASLPHLVDALVR